MSKENTMKNMKIVNRAVEMGLIRFDKLSLLMDLQYVDLDLDGLLKAKDIDFSHDIYGIQFNMNRNTGTLDNLFVPRYSK